MKRSRIILVASALCIVVLCISFFACWRRFDRVDANRVERISLWDQHFVEYELDTDDTARFIELYNYSKYAGEGTGEGGTPEFGIVVHFRDGSTLRVNDFSSLNRDFEVSSHDASGKETAWFYVNSEELQVFISKLVDKYN